MLRKLTVRGLESPQLLEIMGDNDYYQISIDKIDKIIFTLQKDGYNTLVEFKGQEGYNFEEFDFVIDATIEQLFAEMFPKKKRGIENV